MGGGTATVDPYKVSDYLKDAGQALAMFGGAIMGYGAIPEPASPAVIAFGAGVCIGAGLAYSAGMIADAAGK
ncbi:MAG: hypothetical protein JST15_11260 [Bacteroidetes bacterium]|nr:hypothetical protein [Bacteroidota bacterium]